MFPEALAALQAVKALLELRRVAACAEVQKNLKGDPADAASYFRMGTTITADPTAFEVFGFVRQALVELGEDGDQGVGRK